MNRPTTLARLRTELFDICVIGGGGTGAGCVLDATTRGLNAALIEQDDFGSVTSGTSTKLIHGGVRYLEQAVKTFDPKQLTMVRKGLHERRTLLQIAPHLCHPLALLTPCANVVEGLYYYIGLKVYDWLAGTRRLAPSRYLGRAAALKQFPAFDEKTLHSAVLYYDGQFDDLRLNLALIQTAASRGAAVANHLRAEAFQHNAAGKLQAVQVRDKLTDEVFTIRATVFVNATGTRADTLRQSASAAQPPRLRASKGAHAVLPMSAMPSTGAALLVPKTADGRVLFAIPWRNHWLIGTTDTEADPHDKPCLLPDEAEYLIEHVNKMVGGKLAITEVTGGFAGLRPLLQADPTADSRSLVRDHEVETDPTSSLVSIMGGKWTTYRVMAEDTIDACCTQLGQPRPCATETLTLHGSDGFSTEFGTHFRENHPTLEVDIATHLVDTYGTRAPAITSLMAAQPTLSERLVEQYPFVKAEVLYALREEMALTLPDMLMRRIRLGLVNWGATLEALPTVATLMAAELSWSATEQATYQASFQQHIEWLMEQAGVLVLGH